MRWRAIASISLGVNLVLAALVWVALRRPAPVSNGFAPDAQASSVQIKTNVVLRRQFFSWQEVESPDYTTYVANLRDIGCPEQTIRDIIIADVNSLYARRRANELVTPEQQWWRTEPDPELVATVAQKSKALDDERRGLLARLLGTNWESGDLVTLPRPSRQGVPLDGPVLGALPVDTKQAIEEISLRTQDQLQAYLDAQKREGKTPDPTEIARLRQQTRDELQRILTPFQLEEFLLRYSQNANDLRSELGSLKFFNASSNEFRAIFRSTDALDQQIQLLSENDPNQADQRKALLQQRENAIRVALGDRRYEQYAKLHDPVYRDAVATAEKAGTPEAAAIIYEISLASAAEQARINADTNLTSQQRSIELKRLELEQLQANTVLTGQELPPEQPTPPPTPQRKVLVLGPGDSAATVATMYGVPISALRAANPNRDISRLKPGDSINIPFTAMPPGPPAGPPFPIR